MHFFAIASTSGHHGVLERALSRCQTHVLLEPSAKDLQEAGGSGHGATAAAARQAKTRTGVPWEQMMYFSSDTSAIREAGRLGMTSVRLAAAGKGLEPAALRRGLEAHDQKLSDSRGY